MPLPLNSTDTFDRANTALGGVGNDWVDTGNQWSIASNAAAATTDGYSYHSNIRLLRRPETAIGQRHVVRSLGSGLQTLYVGVRGREVSGDTAGYVAGIVGGNLVIFRVDNSNVATQVASQSAGTIVSANEYEIDLEAAVPVSGVTTLTTVLKNITTGTTITTATGTDNAAALQTAGYIYLGGYTTAVSVLSSATSTTYNSAPPPADAVISFDDANIFYSPYGWQKLTTYAAAVNVGAPLVVNITVPSGGGVASLRIDTSALNGVSDPPQILTQVDSAAKARTVLAYNATYQTISLGNLTAGTHTIRLWYAGAGYTNGDKWGTGLNAPPVMAVRFMAIVGPNGTVTAAPPTAKPGLLLVYGDSNTAGAEMLAAGTGASNRDGSVTFGALLGAASRRNAEVGIVGWDSQGYEQAGDGNVPAFPAAYNYLWNGRARSFATPPTEILIVHGRNGNTSAATVAALITSVRAAVGASCKIYSAVSPTGFGRAGVTQGTTDYKTATPGDVNTFFIDATTQGFSETLPANFTATALHLSATGHVNFADAIHAAIVAALIPVVATPTFTPAPGTYTSAQSVTIACATSGASLYYTTDGSTPTASSTPYTGAITVGTTKTVKALAVKAGMTDSVIGVAAYTISLPSVATPTFSPVAGSYTGTQSVTIACATSGATVRYTTDGSTPSDTVGTLFSGAISVPATATLKAIAYKAGMTSSAVVSAAFTITPPVGGGEGLTPAQEAKLDAVLVALTAVKTNTDKMTGLTSADFAALAALASGRLVIDMSANEMRLYAKNAAQNAAPLVIFDLVALDGGGYSARVPRP